MKDDILKIPRDAFSTLTGISNNGAESRENAGAKRWGSVASSIPKENALPDGLVSVPQVADYLCMY